VGRLFARRGLRLPSFGSSSGWQRSAGR
jgi:hypothetical protein